MSEERDSKFPMMQYLAMVNSARRAFPTWRYGQVLFNVLNDGWPALANTVRGTDLDPFHYDVGEEKIGEFLAWLEQQTVQLDIPA